ncbi:helix-turn-helix transcriptional regulator [Actinacidiphila rubida]|uniref:Uncharacterized protein n=1 Tax=Actinacidiphila rubida TaxID=310780 RepID=A0A1H8SML0_9ACTN|nr:helix-turn-helix transcriptional regulator [Actinacidiphila rubida]SEO80199.1 hypothetical protein SAMN05216267_104422 [Actinacidiphila rubida]
MPDAQAHEPLHPGFGVPLGRLLRHRGLTAGTLASRAGSEPAEITALLAGGTPDAGLLRHLAAALGYHAVDLFVLAGAPVPEDLAPLDAEAHNGVRQMIYDVAMRLPADDRRELLLAARSLPQTERTAPFDPPWLPASMGNPGNWIIRMLRYRNLGPTGLMHFMALLTPTCLSASTYFMIGVERVALSSRRVADFALALDIDALELAAIADIVLDESPPPPPQRVVDTRELLWEARRLSAGQTRQLAETARAMAEDVPPGAPAG